MNEQPELKAGMIIKSKHSTDHLFLYINDNWAMCLNNDEWISRNVSTTVTEIYERTNLGTIQDCTKGLKLIWSRKSEKDIKIEEIQKKIDMLSGQMGALSKEMEELKG